MSHTPTPWSDQHKFLDTNLSLLSEADYARAQACVNACAPFEDPLVSIPKMLVENEALKAKVAELEASANKLIKRVRENQ